MILDNVKELCAKKNITIATLEKQCGLGNGTIGKWSKTSPQLENVIKVAKCLNVNISRLIKESKEEQNGN